MSGEDAGGLVRDHYPIVIVGAGPVGLTTANLLGVYGVHTLLVERNMTTVQQPRAVSIDDESLRTIQAIGLIDEVMAAVVPGYGSRYLTPSGRCFLTVEPKGRPYGFPRRNAFRQPQLESQLRAGLNRFPHVEVAFGWTLDSFSQDEDGVVLDLTGPTGRRRITCDYLVGADGGRSMIRKRLCIAMKGDTQPERWLIVDLENSPVEDAGTIVFCDNRRPCIALPGPDLTRRFEFKLLPGETDEEMLEDEMVKRLLYTHGAHPASRICRKIVYTFHALIAERWSAGRIFLAGDAAHLTPPFAGQGMNSGIRDAHNLAWKLAWVVKGRLKPSLLDSYEHERREHVGQMIDLALRMGRIMGPSSRWRGWMTQTAFSIAGIWPPLRSYFAEMKYKPKPRFRKGFLISGDRDPVGRLLPLPKQTTAENEHFDCQLGDGFAIVGIGLSQGEIDEFVSAPLWKSLQTNFVPLEAKSSAEWHLPSTKVLLIVRPDLYVMACTKLDSLAGVESYMRTYMNEVNVCSS